MAVEEEVTPVVVAGSVGWVAVGGLRDVEAGERSLVFVRGVGGGGIVLILVLVVRFSLSSEPSVGEGGTTRHSW